MYLISVMNDNFIIKATQQKKTILYEITFKNFPTQD